MTKCTPVTTQEIARVSGALCQKPKTGDATDWGVAGWDGVGGGQGLRGEALAREEFPGMECCGLLLFIPFRSFAICGVA